MASTRITLSASSTYGRRERPSVPPSRTLIPSGISHRSLRRATATAPSPSSPHRTFPRPRIRRRTGLGNPVSGFPDELDALVMKFLRVDVPVARVDDVVLVDELVARKNRLCRRVGLDL